MNELLANILLTALTGAAGIGANYVYDLLSYALKKRTPATETYSQKLDRLMKSLSEATEEVDEVLQELTVVTRERATRAEALKSDLDKLTTQEQDLRQKINALQNTPIQVAEYFAELSGGTEKQSRRRDYLLFFLGAAVGLVSNIIVNLFISPIR